MIIDIEKSDAKISKFLKENPKIQKVLLYVKDNFSFFITLNYLQNNITKKFPDVNFFISFNKDINLRKICPNFIIPKFKKELINLSKLKISKLNNFDEIFDETFENRYDVIFILNSNIDYKDINKIIYENFRVYKIDKKIAIKKKNKSNCQIIGMSIFSYDPRFRKNNLTSEETKKLLYKIQNLNLYTKHYYMRIDKLKNVTSKFFGVKIKRHKELDIEDLKNNIEQEYNFGGNNYYTNIDDFIEDVDKIRFFIGIENEIFYLMCILLGEDRCILIDRDGSLKDEKLYSNVLKIHDITNENIENSLNEIFLTELETCLS